MKNASKLLIIMILLFLLFGAWLMDKPELEYVRTEYTSSSPTGENFIFIAANTTKYSGAWSGYIRQLYISNDEMGPNQMPKSYIQLEDTSMDCFQSKWNTDFEVEIQSCMKPGSITGTKNYELNGKTIIVHFMPATSCAPLETYNSLEWGCPKVK